MRCSDGATKVTEVIALLPTIYPEQEESGVLGIHTAPQASAGCCALLVWPILTGAGLVSLRELRCAGVPAEHFKRPNLHGRCSGARWQS